MLNINFFVSIFYVNILRKKFYVGKHLQRYSIKQNLHVFSTFIRTFIAIFVVYWCSMHYKNIYLFSPISVTRLNLKKNATLYVNIIFIFQLFMCICADKYMFSKNCTYTYIHIRTRVLVVTTVQVKNFAVRWHHWADSNVESNSYDSDSQQQFFFYKLSLLTSCSYISDLTLFFRTKA